MDYKKILQDLKKGNYAPVYFLCGEEPYFIDKVSDFIEDNILDESEKEFNQSVLYGRDVTPQDIVSTAKRFPMMSEYQVVIVKEAQNIKAIDELDAYIKAPQKSTILVICYKYKKLDKRKAFYKTVSKHGVFLQSDLIRDYKIEPFIEAIVKEKKCTIAPEALRLLAEHLGTDLSKIENELDKLLILLPEGAKINTKDIEENIGISKDYNIFELQKALATRNILKSNQIINYFGQNSKKNPMPMTVAGLYSYFSKLLIYHFEKNKSESNIASKLKISPYFVKEYAQASRNFPIPKTVQVISLLREYDLKSKGLGNSSFTDGDLQRELIFKILH